MTRFISMASSESEMQARLLAQALPFMQKYENKTIVVKYGGHAMGDSGLGKAFAEDIARLTNETLEKIRKRPAAYPEVLATSSEKSAGLDLVRAEICKTVGIS